MKAGGDGMVYNSLKKKGGWGVGEGGGNGQGGGGIGRKKRGGGGVTSLFLALKWLRMQLVYFKSPGPG